jgi:subtilisin family serine protease
MFVRRFSGLRRAALLAATAMATAALVLTTSPLAPAQPSSPPVPTAPESVPGRYIVTLAQQPVATYDGNVRGLAATRPSSGRKVNVTSTASRRYQSYLAKEQSRIAARVGARPNRRYSITLNGFATSLTPVQARALQRTPGVFSVSKDSFHQATDDRNSVDYLKLSGPSGVWAGLGGVAKAGRGVVVGVLDTGIWPESKSFAGAALGTARPTAADPYRPYRQGNRIIVPKSEGSEFHGRCQPGEDFIRATCNTKLVGARYFGDTFLSQYPDTDDTDFISPRDGDGHGSHTASTAAGNNGVSASVEGRSFGKISGVAPAAKIAAYKVLWTGPNQSGGFDSDIVQAIEAAVSDGVDVINYSIGSTAESTHNDPVAYAFLSAASAGIFVSAAGGNSGPGAATLDNTEPWVTTVAANSIAPYEATVRLGNDGNHVGASATVTTRVGPAPIANAADVRIGTASETAASVCTPGTLDPAAVGGKIVVCDRGVVARVDKSAEVKRAGGIGMVLVNLPDNALDADTHSVPTIITNPPASQAIKAYADTVGATASLLPGNRTSMTIPYPQIAGFSSRGPSVSSDGDLLKPDLAAPGVSILAAVAPPSNAGRNFDFISGTSMAAPHVAGLGALFFSAGVHPNWSPMQIKSALMTTAADTKTSSGAANNDPFAQGAGQVRPKQMLNPALVYRSGQRDWLAYLEGIGVDTRRGVAAKDPSDYNAPSIAIGELSGSQTVTRRVTAVTPGSYNATITGLPGVRARVTPSILSFARKGETKTFTVRFTRTTAAFDKAATGFLTWTGRGTRVRSPIAVTPVSAPAEVSGSGASGTIRYQVTPSVSGPFPIKAFGLASGMPNEGELTVDAEQSYSTTIPPGASAKVAQFSVRTPNRGADLDLYVFRVVNGAYELVGASATPAANETVTVAAPEPGSYVALVVGFANAPHTSSTPYTYRDAVVTTSTAEGNFTVTPTNPTASAGRPIPVTVTWSGVVATTPYVGWVEYPDGSGTIVHVN